MTYNSGNYGDGPYSGTTYDAEIGGLSCMPLILVEVALPNGTVYLASDTIRFNEKLYEGKVLKVGAYRRALQQNLGLFEVSSIEINISDADRFLIQQAALDTPKGAKVTLKLGTDKLPLSTYSVFHEGRIDDFGAADFVFRILVKDSLWTLPPQPITGSITTDDFPNALPAHQGKPLQVCYGSHSDTDDNDAKNRGAWPCWYVDVRSGNRTFLVAGHSVQAINEVYAYKPSAGSQLLTETTDYVAYPNGILNGQRMAFINLTTSGFNKLADSTNLGDLTCNVDGKTDLEDGTGNLLTNPVDVMKDFLANYLLSPPFNEAQFARARITSMTRSYQVRGGYTEAVNTDQLIADFCNSFNMRIFPDLNGRIAVNIWEPAGPHDVVKSVRDMWEVVRGSWRIDFNSGIQGAEDAQVVNSIDYTFSYHHAKAFYSGSKTIEDSDSITSYGTKKLKMALSWAGSQNTAKDVAYRMLILFRSPVDHITCKVPLLGMLIDLTDQVAVSHDDAAIFGPYENTTMEVLESTFNPDDFSVDLRLRNIQTIAGINGRAGYFLDDESARVRVSDGTIAVVNTSDHITATGATSWTAAGVVVDDIIRIKNPTNPGNQVNLKILEVISATVVRVSTSVWTTESGMSYEIIPSWLTASDDQKLYGHLCDETTEQFSNGDAGFVML